MEDVSKAVGDIVEESFAFVTYVVIPIESIILPRDSPSTTIFKDGEIGLGCMYHTTYFCQYRDFIHSTRSTSGPLPSSPSRRTRPQCVDRIPGSSQLATGTKLKATVYKLYSAATCLV